MDPIKSKIDHRKLSRNLTATALSYIAVGISTRYQMRAELERLQPELSENKKSQYIAMFVLVEGIIKSQGYETVIRDYIDRRITTSDQMKTDLETTHPEESDKSKHPYFGLFWLAEETIQYRLTKNMDI
uniref:Uncharacterized protein n=1 Tax=Pithovirus LCPAC201 TaxID=2506591 RepID=A0A481Z4Y4_9VIRU|nr:MAG: hypothetical protein LCPAC201_02540 [Pithovirus LCPAC201]